MHLQIKNALTSSGIQFSLYLKQQICGCVDFCRSGLVSSSDQYRFLTKEQWWLKSQLACIFILSHSALSEPCHKFCWFYVVNIQSVRNASYYKPSLTPCSLFLFTFMYLLLVISVINQSHQLKIETAAQGEDNDVVKPQSCDYFVLPDFPPQADRSIFLIHL